MENLKYPIGKFNFVDDLKNYDKWINTINEFPLRLDEQLKQMTETQLEKAYRPDGWTGRQIVHHLADSHAHALIRFKWSISEDHPVIKPYKEDRYAIISDYSLPLEPALQILNGVHHKWSNIMSNLTEEDWQKGYHHPELNKFFTLREASALYAWHCMHHLGHLKIIANK